MLACLFALAFIQQPFKQAPANQYKHQTVAGFSFLISPDAESDPEELGPALAQTKIDLENVRKVLPPKAFDKIKGTRIWVEKADPNTPLLVYHPNAEWLKEHGYNPEMAECVEIGNLKHVIEWHHIQPMMFLHELSHAYNQQVLGWDYPPIKKTYDDAVASTKYESVPFVLGGLKRAYALTNEKEYFAELSEAYFGKNDFYPFVREDLKKFDREGYEVVRTAWNKR
ncbi:MAG TPA: hypothetical protein VGL56_09550 [Fimbriimonadaceae bacterium]|jgi:hypothetical protein